MKYIIEGEKVFIASVKDGKYYIQRSIQHNNLPLYQIISKIGVGYVVFHYASNKSITDLTYAMSLPILLVPNHLIVKAGDGVVE